MRKLIIVIILLCTSLSAIAQREPSWMNEIPRSGNGTYLYVRESGEGATLSEATNQALARVMQNTAMRLGMPFDAQQVNSSLQNGTAVEVIAQQYNIPIRKVDDYTMHLRDGSYRVWVLCQVAVSATVQPQWEELRRMGEVSSGMSLLKSVFVPGLGQMGKGYTAEGVAMLVGEIASVGIAVGCYYIAQSDLASMRSTDVSYADFDASRRRYESLRTTSYIAWGTAAALYAFNLARAAFAQPRRTNGLALSPALFNSTEMPVYGLSFTLNF